MKKNIHETDPQLLWFISSKFSTAIEGKSLTRSGCSMASNVFSSSSFTFWSPDAYIGTGTESSLESSFFYYVKGVPLCCSPSTSVLDNPRNLNSCKKFFGPKAGWKTPLLVYEIVSSLFLLGPKDTPPWPPKAENKLYLNEIPPIGYDFSACFKSRLFCFVASWKALACEWSFPDWPSSTFPAKLDWFSQSEFFLLLPRILWLSSFWAFDWAWSAVSKFESF